MRQRRSLIDSLGPGSEYDDNPEPRIDFRPLPSSLEPDPSKNDSSCTVAPPSERCNDKFDSNKPFELFVDTVPKNGVWGTQGTSGTWDNNILVSAAFPVT